MTALEHRADWGEILRLAQDLPLADLSARFGASPAAIAAAWLRTCPHPLVLDEADDLPPEAGDELPLSAGPSRRPVAEPAAAREAWRVRWRVGDTERVGVVLASGLAAAAAAASGQGEVVAISRVEGRVEEI